MQVTKKLTIKEVTTRGQIKNVNIPVTCIKSLYKSTYKQNVFVVKKSYEITQEDDEFYYIIFDKERIKPMNFAKENHGTYYYFFDYFKIKNNDKARSS